MELPAGVRVFERGWLSANNILFVGRDGTALIDSGYCTHAAQTLDLVGSALGDRQLDLLLNTHLHSDHCGGNAALQSRYHGLHTRIPPGQADFVRAWDPVALTYVPTGQACPRFQIDGTLEPGTVIRLGDLDWEVHAAPGHDPHSVILFEPGSRTLVSADALWESGFGVVFQELEGDQAFGEVAATLDLVEELAPRVVIPGHGPVFGDPKAALALARRRLDGFVRDPMRHATHAAKVLLKFKLLEQQRLAVPEFVAWARATSYFGMVHAKWFAAQSMEDWIQAIASDLVRSGAATQHGTIISNA